MRMNTEGICQHLVMPAVPGFTMHAGAAEECGTPSPSAQQGQAYYGELEATPLSERELAALRDFVVDLKGKWRGEGMVLLCRAAGRWRGSKLELEFEGSPKEKFTVRKRVVDTDQGTVQLGRYTLSRDGDFIELDSQAHLRILELDQNALRFRAKYKIPASRGTVINRETSRSLRLHSDRLIYEEYQYTQGLLSWHGQWTLRRIL